ncbi:MAG: transcription elongation factor GreA [bacterium]
MTQKEYLSKERFKELTAELEQLKTVKRKQVAKELEYAKSLGDLSENAEYQDARESQAALEDRISTLESVLSHVEIVTVHHSNVVEVGSRIQVKKNTDKVEKTYTIVGSEESDMASGKISFKSPLGHALMGKKKGEEFTFKTPGGVAKYTVVSIE